MLTILKYSIYKLRCRAEIPHKYFYVILSASVVRYLWLVWWLFNFWNILLLNHSTTNNMTIEIFIWFLNNKTITTDKRKPNRKIRSRHLIWKSHITTFKCLRFMRRRIQIQEKASWRSYRTREIIFILELAHTGSPFQRQSSLSLHFFILWKP